MPLLHPALSLRAPAVRVLLLASLLSLTSCWWDDDKPVTTSTEAVVDSVVDADLAIAVAAPEYWPTAGWEEAAPELHGFPADAFDSLAADAQADLPYYTSMLVIKDGYLLHESYFDGTPPLEDEAQEAERINQLRDKKHHVYSISKSVTSMTFGVAWTRGDITRLDVTAGDTFSATETGAMSVSDPRLDITPMHALQMRSGLAWNENAWLDDENKSPINVAFSDVTCTGSPNPLLCAILQQSSAYAPGTTWNYSTYDTYLAAAFFTKMTGQSVREYAQQNLFNTLGIEQENIFWPGVPTPAYTFGGGFLHIRSRDLAKLGMLMLQNGKWDGMQLISPEWMNMSLSAQGAGTLAAF
ncbi:MAG: serine hydrolase, partial [Moraxellaceae bacterium]|nr:serine hydrolase [Moraxellaceae bacterium]